MTTKPAFDTAIHLQALFAVAMPDQMVWPWDERDRKRVPHNHVLYPA